MDVADSDDPVARWFSGATSDPADDETEPRPGPAPGRSVLQAAAMLNPPSAPEGHRWETYFADEFPSKDTSVWYRYHNTYGHADEREEYQRDENVVADDTLQLYSKREQYRDRDFTSAFVSTGRRGAQAQPEPEEDTFFPRAGYYEMRARVPQAQGLLPAFWLRHRDGAGTAEVDIMEMFHAQEPGETRQTLHLDGDTNTYRANTSLQPPDTDPEWHTWGVWIEPEDGDVRFRFYVDGERTGDHRAEDPEFWHDFSDDLLWDISVNTFVGGQWSGHPDDELGYDRYRDECMQGGAPGSCDSEGIVRAGIGDGHPDPHDEVFEIDYIKMWTLEEK